MLVALMFATFLPSANAHPGRTDSQGGHTDHSTGEYHYHHGYPAHDHYDMDGDGDVDCPYAFEDKTATSSKSSSPKDEPEGPSRKTSFLDVVSAIFSNLFPALIISIFITLFLTNVILFLFGEDRGWILCLISFILVFGITYVMLILRSLS